MNVDGNMAKQINFVQNVAAALLQSWLEFHLLRSMRMVRQSRNHSHMTTSDHTSRQTCTRRKNEAEARQHQQAN